MLTSDFEWDWTKILWIYICIQAFIGVAAIEYAWARTRRFREQDPFVDAKWDAFIREDVRKWSRLKLYPGAIFLMPTRLLLLVLDGIVLSIVLS